MEYEVGVHLDRIFSLHFVMVRVDGLVQGRDVENGVPMGRQVGLHDETSRTIHKRWFTDRYDAALKIVYCSQ